LIFVFDASRSLGEVRAHWGSPAGVKEALSDSDCQSLRRGHPYYVADSAKGQNCTHFSGDAPGSYVCVPLTAQSELIGMMHLQRTHTQGIALDFSEAYRNLINAIGEGVALAIANLTLRERLSERAMRDQLTGLYNRHYVQEWLALEMRRAQRHGRPFSAILLDIDHFKRFNDNFGHEAGDLVLRELAGVLKRSGRGSDVASRWGGEEFLLLLPECPLDVAVRKAEELRQQVAKLELEYDNRALGEVTVSLGVAAFPDNAQGAEALLRCADEAMYKAKRAGRDRVVACSEALQAQPGTAWNQTVRV
jgi:diguanylate cyclase (GGDEF)-like protein